MKLGGDELVSAELAAGATVGPFSLGRQIGSDAHSNTWLATYSDGQARQLVALRLPFISLDPERFARRIVQQRDLLVALRHPGIARFYDAGIASNGQPYVAMQHVEGTPLIALCDRLRLGIRERLELFQQVLGVLQYAHSMLAIHRDLQPFNILLGDDHTILVRDFGVAALLSDDVAGETESATAPGGRGVSFNYASPEGVAGKPLGTGCDLYSAGMVLCELLTGAVPYHLKRQSRRGIAEEILNLDPAIPSLLVTEEAAALRATSAKLLTRQLRGDLDTIILKSLHKRPEGRYLTAEAMSQELRRYCRGESIRARNPGPWVRALRFLGRALG